MAGFERLLTGFKHLSTGLYIKKRFHSGSNRSVTVCFVPLPKERFSRLTPVVLDQLSDGLRAVILKTVLFCSVPFIVPFRPAPILFLSTVYQTPSIVSPQYTSALDGFLLTVKRTGTETGRNGTGPGKIYHRFASNGSCLYRFF